MELIFTWEIKLSKMILWNFIKIISLHLESRMKKWKLQFDIVDLVAIKMSSSIFSCYIEKYLQKLW